VPLASIQTPKRSSPHLAPRTRANASSGPAAIVFASAQHGQRVPPALRIQRRRHEPLNKKKGSLACS